MLVMWWIQAAHCPPCPDSLGSVRKKKCFNIMNSNVQNTCDPFFDILWKQQWEHSMCCYILAELILPSSVSLPMAINIKTAILFAMYHQFFFVLLKLIQTCQNARTTLTLISLPLPSSSNSRPGKEMSFQITLHLSNK